jgi:hypothetical protein
VHDLLANVDRLAQPLQRNCDDINGSDNARAFMKMIPIVWMWRRTSKRSYHSSLVII